MGWQPLPPPRSIDDLNDVDTTTDAPIVGDVLKWDGDNWVPAEDLAESGGSPGGGGKSYITLPMMKPPDSAGSTDDEFDQANGTDPTSASWSWGNQGSATAEVRSGRLRLSMPASGSTVLRGLFQAAPAGDFDIAAPVTLHNSEDNYQAVGICLLWGTLATPTEIQVAILTWNSASANRHNIQAQKYTNYTTYVSTHTTLISHNARRLPLRIAWDSTAQELDFDYSLEPAAYEWEPIASGVSGPASDPDYVGVICQINNAAAFKGFFDWFRQDWTADFDPTTDD